MKSYIFLMLFSFSTSVSFTQVDLKIVLKTNDSIDFKSCKVGIVGKPFVEIPSEKGEIIFKNILENKIEIQTYCIDFKPVKLKIELKKLETNLLEINIEKLISEIEEMQVLGTIKETNKLENPILTEVYDKKHFAKNPSASLLDIMDRMNGVRSQVNCNICGTGDIHLNGLEGAYTLIILDGVPIIGGLSSVYGLSGIPSFMLDRIEVTKGPASSIYGSEALGGVIHAFSKKSNNKFNFQLQNYTTSHLENNLDLGLNFKISKKISLLTSANFYYFNHFLDQNKDNFSDVPLQKRASLFQRWNFTQKSNRIFNINYRFMQEERWGGEKNWSRNFRGSDSIYAETIDLKRFEFNLAYQLPLKEKILLLAHSNLHIQDSYYGTTKFDAQQSLNFLQLTWDKKIKKNELLSGLAYRYTIYDDNTILTENKSLITSLPGVFAQDLIQLNAFSKLLISSRVDYYNTHGFIFTPRVAFSKNKENHHFRIHAGSGFRVVNLFTEDHASLSGSREIVIKENLKPERSFSVNASQSFNKKYNNKIQLEIDFTGFYTYFSNRIVPDYLTDVNKIIYSNINGYGLNYGTGFEVKIEKASVFSFIFGSTFMKVYLVENNIKSHQLLTENLSANWTFSYYFKKIPLSIDYTGNLIGPMTLPLLGDLDPRPSKSSAYSIQNIQLTYTKSTKLAFFTGIKNLLNWTPAKNLPFLIARANDPFDKNVTFDQNGNVISTNTNPYALTFDPSYVFASNQGIRFYIGLKINLD
jgi:outer membrane receptor for ferrienterochelin and colicins